MLINRNKDQILVGHFLKMGVVSLKMYGTVDQSFGQPNAEISCKMANGQLLVLVLN